MTKDGFDKRPCGEEKLHLGEKEKTIADMFPNIGRILLFVAFEEADSDSEPNYQQIILTPESEAALQLDCSREDCACGGFDFAHVIDKMVKNDESRSQGKLECQGTLGGDGEPCRLKAEYRIVID